MIIKKIIFLLLLGYSSIVFSSENYSVNTQELNVRSCPDKSCNSAFKLSQGDQVEIIKLFNNNWCEIKSDKGQGFVYSEYLLKNESKKNGSFGFIHQDLLIKYSPVSIPILLLLITFFLTANALKNYGSIVTLISAVFYFFFGLTLNLITNIFVSESIGSIGISIFTYVLAFVVLILSIISFFKNTGIAITILSAIIFSLDSYSNSFFGVLIIVPSIYGGIAINIGYKQISKKK